MADSDKNIRITTNKNKPPGNPPKIVFTGSSAGSSVITLEVNDDNSISFSSNEGQIFSLDNNLTVGTIWSVNDVSGLAILRASAGGTIVMSQYPGGVGIGETIPSTGTYKFTVRGQSAFASTNSGTNQFTIDTSAATGSNSMNVLAANYVRWYNTASTFYTGLRGGAATSNIDYVLPIGPPSGAGTSILASTSTGTMSWVALAAGGSGTVTTLTAGVGITFSTGTTITTTGTIRAKRPLLITFASGYTPATGTTADDVVFRIPKDANDGTTDITYFTREAFIRSETTTAGSTRIQIEKYTGTGVFAATSIISGAGLSVGGAGIAESRSTSFAAAGTALTTGDKLRVNFQAISSAHTDLLITLLLEER
jgi:hypothetical protein